MLYLLSHLIILLMHIYLRIHLMQQIIIIFYLLIFLLLLMVFVALLSYYWRIHTIIKICLANWQRIMTAAL